MNEQEEIKVYGPSLFDKVMFGVFGLTFGSLAIAFLTFHVSHPKSDSMPFVYCFSLLSLFFIWRLYVNIFHNLPQLILSQKGIEWRHSRKLSQFYVWEDVGVFKLIHAGPGLWPHYSACAYNSKNHRVLDEDINATTASRFTSDISITIHALDCGYFKADQQKVVDELNKWRKKYSSEEVDEQSLTPFDVRTLKAKHETKISAFNHMAGGVIILGVIMLIISLMSH